MALTKATYGMISADTSTIDLNIDANTLYVDSSANRVGIGTNSPAASLHIGGAGHLLIERGGEVRSKDTGGTVKTLVRVNGSNELEYGWSGAGPVKFMGGGSYAEKMRVHTDGNISIGGYAPSFTNGGGLEIERADSATLRIQRYGADAAEIFMDSTGFNVKDLSHGTMKFGTANTERMRLNSTGLGIGLGGNNPSAPLHAHGTSEEVIRLDSGNTGAIHFFEGSTRRGIIGYSNGSSIAGNADAGDMIARVEAGKKLHLAISGTSKLTVDSAGKVGIGTTAPSNKLHVAGVTNTDGIKIQGGEANVSLIIENDATNGVAWDISSTGGGHGYGDGALHFGVAFGQPKVKFQSDGKVGIGTNSPANKLHISGGNFQIDTDTNSSLTIKDGGSDAIQIVSATGDELYIGPNNAYKLRFKTDGNVVMDNGGNFGVGIASPAHPLSVSAANAKIVAHSTADSQTIGFHAKYLDHATLYGSFEYTTGDAQLYIDNHFAGNNAAYSTINFRNCNNASNTLQTRMSIAGSTGMVTVNNRLRVANAGTATAGTVALEVLGNRNDSVVPANASAKFYAYSDGDGLALGNYTSSPYGSYLQAGYLLDSYGTAYNNGYPITLNPVGGNVGIGACGKDPLDILHIERSVNGAVQIQVDNQNTGNASYAGLYLNGQGNGFYLKNWGDSVSGKSNVTEFNTTASNQYMIFTPGNTHNLSLFNDEAEFGSATADSKVTINPPNTSNAKAKTPTVIGFYHYYKTSPGADYAHMKTNFPTGGNTGTFGMIAIEATGYRYSSAQTIKGMWGFHNWNGGTYQSTAENLISSGGHDFCHSTYVSSDGYIVLVARSGGTGSVYVGARLDFIDIQADYTRHGTAYWPPAVTAISWSNNTTGVY